MLYNCIDNFGYFIWLDNKYVIIYYNLNFNDGLFARLVDQLSSLSPYEKNLFYLKLFGCVHNIVSLEYSRK